MNKRGSLKLVWGALLLAAAGTVFGMAAKTGALYDLDLSITQTVQSVKFEWFVWFNKIVSWMELGVVVIIIPVSGILWFKGKKKEAVFLILSGLSWFVAKALKSVFNLPCPNLNEVIDVYPLHGISDVLYRDYGDIQLSTSACYPSGHVFDFVTVWGMLWYLRKKITGSTRVQSLIAIFTVNLIIFIGLSRIFLGAHWFTDVVGGYLLGFSWLFILIVLYKNIR